MTTEQVGAIMREQTASDENLRRLLVAPRCIAIIVRDGVHDDKLARAWLVGEERPGGGYKIIMRDDDAEFGLATDGFPTDKHDVLVGWYGDLRATIESM